MITVHFSAEECIHTAGSICISNLYNLKNNFVFPYLIYCCEIWGNTSQIHLDSLIKCQKKNTQNYDFFTV